MATQGLQMKFGGVQNNTFEENSHENERIGVILGCAISFIAHAKHGCTGGWLILCAGYWVHKGIYWQQHSLDSRDGLVLIRQQVITRDKYGEDSYCHMS